MKTEYQVGDTVYIGQEKYKVMAIDENKFYGIETDFGCFTLDGKDRAEDNFPILSFTPYTLENGGATFTRPLPKIEVDTLIYVLNEVGLWNMRYFSHFDKIGKCHCFSNQLKSKDNSGTLRCDHYSLTNPLA